MFFFSSYFCSTIFCDSFYKRSNEIKSTIEIIMFQLFHVAVCFCFVCLFTCFVRTKSLKFYFYTLTTKSRCNFRCNFVCDVYKYNGNSEPYWSIQGNCTTLYITALQIDEREWDKWIKTKKKHGVMVLGFFASSPLPLYFFPFRSFNRSLILTFVCMFWQRNVKVF